MASALTRIFFRKGQLAVLLTQPYFNNSRLDNTQNIGGSPIMWIFGTVQNRPRCRNLFSKYFSSSPITRPKTAALEGNPGYRRTAIWENPIYLQCLYLILRKNWVKHGNFLAKINVWTENSHLDLRCVYKTVQICLISFGLAHKNLLSDSSLVRTELTES